MPLDLIDDVGVLNKKESNNKLGLLDDAGIFSNKSKLIDDAGIFPKQSFRGIGATGIWKGMEQEQVPEMQPMAIAKQTGVNALETLKTTGNKILDLYNRGQQEAQNLETYLNQKPEASTSIKDFVTRTLPDSVLRASNIITKFPKMIGESIAEPIAKNILDYSGYPLKYNQLGLNQYKESTIPETSTETLQRAKLIPETRSLIETSPLGLPNTEINPLQIEPEKTQNRGTTGTWPLTYKEAWKNIANEELQTAKQGIEGMGEIMGKPIGAYGLQELKKSWLTHPIESALVLYSYIAPIVSKSGREEISNAIDNLSDKIKTSDWYGKLPWKEKGLVALSYNELLNRGWEASDLAKMNDTYFRDALEASKQMIKPEPGMSVSEIYDRVRNQNVAPEDIATLTPEEQSQRIDALNENIIRKNIKPVEVPQKPFAEMTPEEQSAKLSMDIRDQILNKPATLSGLITKYVNETGQKIETQNDIQKVINKYPDEYAQIEASNKLKQNLWNKLPEEFRKNRGINEYTTDELQKMQKGFKPAIPTEEPPTKPPEKPTAGIEPITPTEEIPEFKVGSKVQIGKSPQVYEIIEEQPFNAKTDIEGEKYFNVKNIKTGKIEENVGLEDLKLIKPKFFPQDIPVLPEKIIEEVPLPEVLKPAKEKIQPKVYPLDENKTLAINQIKTDLEIGQPPQLLQKEGEYGIEYTRTLDKAINGEKLTDKQYKILEDIIDAKTTELDNQKYYVREQLPKINVGELNLKVGDEFKINGEKFKVEDIDKEGNFKIKDSIEYIVDPFDKIPKPDKGSLKTGKTIKESSLAYQGEPKMETEIQGQKKLALAFKPEEGFRREIGKPQSQQELIKRSDIAKFIQEKFDIPIRIGRFGGGALGIFKPKLEVVRTKFAHDIETISHEVGHALQKFLWGNLSSRPFKAFEDELIPIATKPKSGQPKSPEGFAEFIRLYSTNNEKALEKAPRFYKYFDDLLKEKSPEAREILLETRDRFEKYLTQTPEQRKLSQISINDKGDKKGITLQDIITKFIDELTPLKNIVNEITQGEDIPVIKDPYKLARMIPGVWGKADAFLEYKPFNYNTYKFSGKSLKEILNQIPKDRIDLYRSYQISKSEYESYQNSLKEGGKPFIADPISIQDAKYIIDKYDSEFKKIFQENVAYRDALLKYFRDSGMLSGDTYRKFKELYKNYVPLYRVMETEKGMGAGKGLEVYQPIRTRRGSWRDFVDPIESDIKNTYLFISLAEKNAVVNALIDLSNSKPGMGKYVEKIPFPTKKIIVKTDEILSQLSNDPLFSEIIKEFPDIEKVVSIFRKSAFTPKENIISVWKNGEQNLYQVHPDIARTIQSLDTEEINTVIKLLNYPTRWLRAGAVLSPEFLGRNPIRDQFTAFVYSKYGYIPGVDLIRGIYDIANKSEDYWKFKISGAEHSMFVSLDRTTLQKTVDNILSNKSLFHDVMKSGIKNPIELLRVLSEYGEMGTRIGEFKKGLQKEGETKTGILESGFPAREISIDFAKKGSFGKVVNMIVAFWNASVQGGVKMYEQHKEEYKAFPHPPKGHKIPLPTTMKAIAAITIPSIVLAIINYDDDKIKEVPQWQKDLFWLIRIGDTIVRIPKPFELGIIYGTLPERIVNYILSKDSHAFDKFIQTFTRGALPSAIPTVMLPLMENWANKSYFLNRPIVPKSREGVQPEYQYQPYTTEVAKIAGKIISKFPFIGETSAASPAKIENLIQGWTGGLGKHVLNTLDYGLRKAGIVQDKVKPTSALSDIPFIKGFIVRYPSASTESIQTFYDNYEKATKTVNTIRSLVKEYNPEEARKLSSESENVLKLNQHYTALNELSDAISMVYDNPQMTPDEKRQLIDQFYLQMIAIARNGNEIYKER